MNILNTYEKLEELGRVRLSKNFFMRDFLYSEIAAWHGIRNIPENPERAIHSRPCKTSATRMNIGFAPVPLCA